jgi:hypothetical protein
MSVWDEFGFEDAVANIQAAMAGGQDEELKRRKRMARDAYLAAHERRGLQPGQILNSAVNEMLGLDDD